MKITPVAPPDDNDFESLRKGLTQFNESFTGPVFRERIASFIKSVDGSVLGGILGEINWNWLHIQGLWVDEAAQGGGWGSELMLNLERYALSKGIVNIRVETSSFQALDFYLKLGYTVFAELPDMPQGHTSYFLKKQLELK